MSKFEKAEKREGLIFDYEAYDVVVFSDGSKGMITDYGIYDNQYWCEFPESRECGVADWFWSNNNNGYKKHIVSKVEEASIITSIKEKYLEKLIVNKKDFNIQNKDLDNEIRLIQSMLE